MDLYVAYGRSLIGKVDVNGVLRHGVAIDVMSEAQYVVRRIEHKGRLVLATILIDQGRVKRAGHGVQIPDSGG